MSTHEHTGTTEYYGGRVTAFIASRTPVLAQLAVDSLRTFAPTVQPVVINTGPHHFPIFGGLVVQLPEPVQGAAAHPLAIEWARKQRLHAGSDLVMLMDDDAMVTSHEWGKVVLGAFEREPQLGVVGGRWLWDFRHQATYRGHVLPHASMLVMRRPVFDVTPSFAPPARGAFLEGDLDTAGECSVVALNRGLMVRALPYIPDGQNLIFRGLPRVQEYVGLLVDGVPGDAVLWAHCGRGTSWAPAGRVREAVRRVTALWSPRSQKILRRQRAREAYIIRGREWLVGVRT